ncbi:MAG: PaaI family thioesterase [Oceanobacter sp.]
MSDNTSIDYRLIHQCINEGLSNIPVVGSGISDVLKQVIVSAKPGEVELEFTPGKEFIQGNGVLQGGALAMLLDAALAYSGLSMVEPTHTVVSLNIHAQFFRPAHPGTLRAKARVDKPGRSVMFSSAELIGPDGKVLATAESPLMVLPI